MVDADIIARPLVCHRLSLAAVQTIRKAAEVPPVRAFFPANTRPVILKRQQLHAALLTPRMSVFVSCSSSMVKKITNIPETQPGPAVLALVVNLCTCVWKYVGGSDIFEVCGKRRIALEIP